MISLRMTETLEKNIKKDCRTKSEFRKRLKFGLVTFLISSPISGYLAYREYRYYEADMERYKAGEINNEPSLSDYTPFNRLKQWFFAEENVQ